MYSTWLFAFLKERKRADSKTRARKHTIFLADFPVFTDPFNYIKVGSLGAVFVGDGFGSGVHSIIIISYYELSLKD